ncbi:HD-GYP domain-containing protein [Elusimicrobiota bacterium]
MIRISDIYKNPEDRDKQKSVINGDFPAEKPVPKKRVMELDPEEVYNDALLLAKEKIDTVKSANHIRVDEKDLRVIGNLLKCVKNNRKGLLKFFYENTPANYLYAHSVNVCILSLVLAHRMVYNQDQLIELSLASFFHDMGMAHYFDIVNVERRLTPYEKKEVEEHTLRSRDINAGIEGLDNRLKNEMAEISYQHHERENGKGYPDGIDDEEINNFSRIVIISDIYEALTHNRQWRDAYNFASAVDIILGYKGNLLSRQMVKLLVDELSLFPVGCEVQLNDGRIAKVIEIREKCPTRPLVKVIKESDGKKAKEELIDLSTQKLVAVEDIIHCNEGDFYEKIS